MKRVLLLALAIVAVALCLTGCKNESAKTDETRKILRMGTNAAFEPFEFVADNEKGLVSKFDGIDVTLAKAIADKYNYDLEIVDMDFDSLGLALESDKVDFIAAGFSVTPEREKTFDFSVKYYTAIQYIIIREDSKDAIKSAEDLKNKHVGVQIATTGDILCEEMGLKVSSYKRGSDAIMALNNKQLDAVVIDSEPAKKFLKNTKGLLVVEDPKAFEKEEYAMAVKKGNKDLLTKIDSVLGEYVKNGKILEIVEKYAQ